MQFWKSTSFPMVGERAAVGVGIWMGEGDSNPNARNTLRLVPKICARNKKKDLRKARLCRSLGRRGGELTDLRGLRANRPAVAPTRWRSWAADSFRRSVCLAC